MSANARGLETSLCFFKLEGGNYCSTTFIYFRKINMQVQFLLIDASRFDDKIVQDFLRCFLQIEGLFWGTHESFNKVSKWY